MCVCVWIYLQVYVWIYFQVCGHIYPLLLLTYSFSEKWELALRKWQSGRMSAQNFEQPCQHISSEIRTTLTYWKRLCSHFLRNRKCVCVCVCVLVCVNIFIFMHVFISSLPPVKVDIPHFKQGRWDSALCFFAYRRGHKPPFPAALDTQPSGKGHIEHGGKGVCTGSCGCD